MIFSFDKPHKIGSICSFPCKQCNDDPDNPEYSKMTDGDKKITFQPLKILKETTKEEFVKWVKSTNPKLKIEEESNYYYEVETD